MRPEDYAMLVAGFALFGSGAVNRLERMACGIVLMAVAGYSWYFK